MAPSSAWVRGPVGGLLVVALLGAACGGEPRSEIRGLEASQTDAGDEVGRRSAGSRPEAAEEQPVARSPASIDGGSLNIFVPVLPTGAGADSYRTDCDILDEGYESACL